MEQKTTSHIIKGIIIAIILIAIDVAGQLINLKFSNSFVIGNDIIIIASIIIAVFVEAKQQAYSLQFKDLFVYGFKVGAVFTCLFFLYNLLSVNFIFPDYIDKKFYHDIEEARKTQVITNEQIQAGIKLSKKAIKMSIIAGSVMSNLIIAVIGAVLSAFIIPKKTFNKVPNI